MTSGALVPACASWRRELSDCLDRRSAPGSASACPNGDYRHDPCCGSDAARARFCAALRPVLASSLGYGPERLLRTVLEQQQRQPWQQRHAWQRLRLPAWRALLPALLHGLFLRLRAVRLPWPSRAFAACNAFRRRSISASEIPAGRLLPAALIALVAALPAAVCATPGFGPTTRLRLVSTTPFLVRPWLKLCFTLPGRAGAPRRPNVFLPSLSLI